MGLAWTRRVYFRRGKEFEQYGLTELQGVYGSKGTRAAEHSEECRERITNLMLEDSSDAARAAEGEARRGLLRGSGLLRAWKLCRASRMVVPVEWHHGHA